MDVFVHVRDLRGFNVGEGRYMDAELRDGRYSIDCQLTPAELPPDGRLRVELVLHGLDTLGTLAARVSALEGTHGS